jgi:hypothetical protein
MKMEAPESFNWHGGIGHCDEVDYYDEQWSPDKWGPWYGEKTRERYGRRDDNVVRY